MIALSADRITAKAGEKVKISVVFDKPAYASVNERRSQVGYQPVMRTNEKVIKIDIEATVHDDTTDFIIMTDTTGETHLADRQNAVEAWYHVTVVDMESEHENSHKTDETTDLGMYKYSVGLLSDLHLSKDSDEWSDEADLRRAMDFFAADKNIKFIASCGDLIESGSPKKATPDADAQDFREIYDVDYWQKEGLRLFSPLGNHDFYGIFESRNGDTVLGKPFTNYNSISGYNISVNSRIASVWLTGGGVNSIPNNGRDRIVFDLEEGKHTAVGQADMRFLAFNAYVENYKAAAGYTAKLAPVDNRYSDEAMRAMKSYVTAHWSDCKDNLSGWNTGSKGMRNNYSKLSYWLQKGGEIYIFLSVDYGDDIWPVNAVWHDRMVHARTVIDVTSDDPYVRRMVEYVADTGYSNADKPYNFQYYSPNALVWLKEIVENNADKKIFIFTHHFLPNRAGNGAGVPKDGNWMYADIYPATTYDAKEVGLYPKGSNALTGIEFWFLTKLLNKHRNIIFFSGHSHISMSSGENFDNHDYPIVMPELFKGSYVYTKQSQEPLCESAWTVSLPSLSKPRHIVGGQSVRRYEDAELAVMEIYEHGVKIKGYRVRKDNKDVKELLAEKSIPAAAKK